MRSEAAITAVLPLRGLVRARLLSPELCGALEALGLDDLAQLSGWSRRELARRGGLAADSLDRLERLLARYCLSWAAARRRRVRRPGRWLDPY